MNISYTFYIILFSSVFSRFWMIMDWKPWAYPIKLSCSGFIPSPIFPVFIWKLCLIFPYGMQRIPKILSKRLLTFIGLDGDIESWAGSEVQSVCRKTFSQGPSIRRSPWRLLGMSQLRVPCPSKKGVWNGKKIHVSLAERSLGHGWVLITIPSRQVRGTVWEPDSGLAISPRKSTKTCFIIL